MECLKKIPFLDSIWVMKVSLKALTCLLFFILSLIDLCHSILAFNHCEFMINAAERDNCCFIEAILHAPNGALTALLGAMQVYF